MSEAISAFGTTLKIGDGATPEVFAAIAEVTNVGGPGMSLDTVDITHPSSTGGWKEYTA